MAYIRIVGPEEAQGDLARDYASISEAYSTSFSAHVPTPQVYRTHSIIPAYFHYGAVQMGSTRSAEQYVGEGVAPGVLVNFGVALYSSCFY